MTEKKSKRLYWLFKFAGILISCVLPIWAICEKFPLWTEEHGTGASIGIGAILILVVVLIIFKRTVFYFIRDHFDLKHAPPLTVWIVMIVLSYLLVYLGAIMKDMTTVFWMGFVGCCIGTALTYVSERFNPKKENDDE
jgi:hypothetical protein